MTFVPQQRQSIGTATTFRTVFFWVLMIALAVMLWQMASRNKSAPAAPEISYSDFMSEVDKANIAEAHLYESPSTAEVQGRLRQPPSTFRTTIPKESIPALTDQLRKQGTSIEVSEAHSSDWTELIFNSLPFLVLLAIWIFVMSRRTRQTQAPPPTNAANRPIG